MLRTSRVGRLMVAQKMAEATPQHFPRHREEQSGWFSWRAGAKGRGGMKGEQIQRQKRLFTFPKIHSLENISGPDAIDLRSFQELRDLLHLLKGHL